MPKGRGFKLLDAYVEVTGDGTAVVQGVTRDVENDGGAAAKAGSGFGKKLVGGIVGSFAALKIGQFIGESITAASDLNETVSKSNTIFGASSGAINSWAQNAATNIGLSRGAALAAASGFGDMFTQMGYTSEQAAALSKTAVTAAADLGSFSNLDTADVSDRIAAAFRGEYDSLQAVIPGINAARVEKEALALSGKTSADALTEQEKAQAVLNIVQTDGAKAMGDYARTADSVANRQKTAAAQTEDLKAALGDSLLPIVQEILGVVISQFLPALQAFAGFIKENSSVIMPLVIILGVMAAAIWAVNAAMYANPITLIILGIGLLIAAIVLLVANWDVVVAWLTEVWGGFVGWLTDGLNAVAAWWNELWAGISQWFIDVWNSLLALGALLVGTFVQTITVIVDAVVGWWNGLWAGVASFFTDIWNGLVALGTLLVSTLIQTIITIVGAVVGWWNGLWSGIASFFGGVWAGIVSFGRDAINNLVGFFTGLPGQIMGALSGAASWLVRIGGDIVSGLRQGISDAWSGLMGWFEDLVGGIMDAAKSVLGIASPSRRMRHEVGRQLPAGAELGLKDGKASLDRTVRSMFDLTAPKVSLGAELVAPRSRAEAGTLVNIDTVTVEATQMSDMGKAIETLRGLGQTARQGRGMAVTAGMGA